MNYFTSDKLRLAYRDEGEGDPILLIHGFASNSFVNWVYPGWSQVLMKSGRRVLAIDNRGHGESDKPHDSAFYSADQMAEDARRLLDHLDLERADIMGYSMGARITAFLAINHPDRVRSAVFGGLGINMIRGMQSSQEIIDALEAPTLADVPDEKGLAYRKFAEATRSDLKALAACMTASRKPISAEHVSGITAPVLVAIGTKDDVSGSGQELADLIPGARALDIPGRDHMVAVGDKVYKAGVLEFLGQRP